MGYIADICTLRSFSKRYIDLYDVFIFSRPRYGRKLLKTINTLSQAGKQILADYDDLLFDPELSEHAPHVLMGLASPHVIAARFSEYQRALHLFSTVLVATQPLADAVSKVHPKARVYVIHNGLSQQWVDHGQRFPSTETSPVIGYFPGTRSHNHDFEVIEKSLSWHLHRHPHTRLMIVGSLDFNIQIFPKRQLMRHTGVEYEHLPALIKACTVTLAPLADNPFNQCKSGLKFFESAIFGIPVISSPIPDMQRFKCSRIRLAEDHADWLNYLQSAEHSHHNTDREQQIKQYAQNNCMSMQQTRQLLLAIQKKISPFQYEYTHTSRPRAA